MPCEVQHGIAGTRLVPIRIGNHRARVIRYDQLRRAAPDGQRASNAAQPVFHRLGRRRTRERVARGAHGVDGHVRSALGCDWQRGLGEVDEQLLASAVDLTRRALQTLCERLVVLAELRVER